MNKKITYRNGFRAIKTLEKAALDPRIEEIEGNAMDEGRVFLHCASGYWFGPMEGTACHSVGSAAEVREAMAKIEKKPEGAGV